MNDKNIIITNDLKPQFEEAIKSIEKQTIIEWLRNKYKKEGTFKQMKSLYRQGKFSISKDKYNHIIWRYSFDKKINSIYEMINTIYNKFIND